MYFSWTNSSRRTTLVEWYCFSNCKNNLYLHVSLKCATTTLQYKQIRAWLICDSSKSVWWVFAAFLHAAECKCLAKLSHAYAYNQCRQHNIHRIDAKEAQRIAEEIIFIGLDDAYLAVVKFIDLFVPTVRWQHAEKCDYNHWSVAALTTIQSDQGMLLHSVCQREHNV